MAALNKPYDLILLGAAGFTGSRTAQYIALHGPRNLRWAIAGRNRVSLDRILSGIRDFIPAPDMHKDGGPAEPAIEMVDDFESDGGRDRLDVLVRKAVVVVSAVGPFHRYGRPVVAACAENGVHYVDCTGEVPWVADMIDRYHDAAATSGAYMLPQCGIDSVPSDVLTWLLAEDARKRFGFGLKQAVNVCTEMSMQPSNGTATTLLSLLDSYSVWQIFSSMAPFALSPRRPKKAVTLPPTTIGSILTGLWHSEGQNNLVQTPLTKADMAQIGRSWGLHQDGRLYGPRFTHGVFLKAPNFLYGLAIYYVLLILQAMLVIPPLRRLLQKFDFDPDHDRAWEKLVYRATGLVDSEDPDRDRVSAWMDWTGDGYYLTGIFMAEASFTLLEHVGRVEGIDHDFDGRSRGIENYEITGRKRTKVTEACKPGFITPSTLGYGYVRRLNRAGVKIRSTFDGTLEEKKKR